MPGNRPMPRRQAQVLAAIVFLANRAGGKVPTITPLCSLIGQRPRDARDWLEHFRQYKFVNYFFGDDTGPMYINRKRLVVGQAEAITVLALHRASRRLQTTGDAVSLVDLVAVVEVNPQLASPASLKAILKALGSKGYVRDTGDYYLCTPLAEYQLPYIRIVARNFQPAKPRITKRTAA